MKGCVIRLGALALLLTGGQAMAQAEATACLLSCFKERACEVEASSGRLALSGDTFRFVPSCKPLTVASGRVLVRYRSRGAWFSPPDVPQVGTSLSQVFAANAPDRCSVPTSDCIQTRLNEKVAAAAGHGIDGQRAAPGGTGEPCRRGLPCGLVLAPQGAWQFRLNDAVDGQWQVRLLRGEAQPGGPKAWAAPVAAGMVNADGRQFEAGRVYAYSLVDRAGAVIATGEFETVGVKRMEILQRLAQRRVAEGMPERAAWIDTMLNADLEWDALHTFAGN